MKITGLHHVTAIAGDAQRNLDFYTGVLGLRLVKRTVNFDDPGTYHFYFGDTKGSPGTILTFFPWQRIAEGRAGSGMVSVTAFGIPQSSTGYWIERLVSEGVDHRVLGSGQEGSRISLRDHDGLAIELVGRDAYAHSGGAWAGGAVPAEHAIRSFHGVTLAVSDPDRSARLLTETFGFEPVEDSGVALVLAAPGKAPGRVVEIAHDASVGRSGRGTVHHVAFRAASDEEQQAWREKLLEAGYLVTPVRDRQYFRSIYFREPGGVLYEIATDAPGFDLDESEEMLGMQLKLPAWLESRRGAIEAALPAIRVTADERPS